MKSLYAVFTSFFLLVCINLSVAQEQISAWEIHYGNDGLIEFPTQTDAQRKEAFGKATIPEKSDPRWELAKTQKDGTVNYPDLGENVKKCAQQLDFTYFQTFVKIPKNADLQSFTVSYDKADDGARIYFFNSKYPKGHYNEASDLIRNASNYKKVDLKDQLVKGEDNRIVIVQYNQCTKNSIMGIRVEVNSREIVPAVLPTRFRLHAYSISGKRVEKGSNFWMGFNPTEKGPRITGRILSAQTGTVMEIEKEEVDKGIIALKVVNGPEAGSYLTIQDDNTVKVMKYPATNQRTQFKVRHPEESGAGNLSYVSFESVWRPNHFLRHEGYVLKVSPATDANRRNVVYRQDASWLFEPMK